MKNISVFLSENVQFLEVKISIYLNWHVLEQIAVLVTITYLIKSLYMMKIVCVLKEMTCLISSFTVLDLV